MFEEFQGGVRLTMTQEEYVQLMLYLGFATGAAANVGVDELVTNRMLKLINSLNMGNPNYRPYEVPEG